MRLSPFLGRQRWALMLPVFLSLALVGCGASTAKVSGKVTYGDKIVKGGDVTFVVEGKGTASARINEDGTYTVEGVPAGTAKVCVDTKALNPANVTGVVKFNPPKDAKLPEGLAGAGADKAELQRRFVAIPERYADLNKTPLTTTITGGTQEYNIKIEP